MNNLQIFDHPKFGEVRTITEDGVTLFCGKDVAVALGYKRPADAITAHCKGSVIRRLLTKGGEQDVKFIPEGDLYRLAAKSELPGADVFERWIFDVVLPSIRKTGRYSMAPRPNRDACTDTHLLKVFENPDNPYMHSLRVIMIGSEPWFVGKDVVLAVGYRGTKGILDGHVLQRNLLRTNPRSMLVSTRILLDKCGPHLLDLLEQMWFPTLVNVPGLFDLIHSCTRPRIRDFEAWLREGILPALQVELPQSERPALPTPAPSSGKKEPPADPAQGNRLIGSICCMLANADLPTLNSVFRFLSESQT